MTTTTTQTIREHVADFRKTSFSDLESLADAAKRLGSCTHDIEYRGAPATLVVRDRQTLQHRNYVRVHLDENTILDIHDSAGWTGEFERPAAYSGRSAHNRTLALALYEFAPKLKQDLRSLVIYWDGQKLSEPELMVQAAQWFADVCEWHYDSPKTPTDTIKVIAELHGYDPVLQYLKSLMWDGTPRLHTAAHKYLSTKSELENVMLRKWMISAVARTFEPGCQVDSTLVLFSAAQGVGKSTFFRALVRNMEWYRSGDLNITTETKRNVQSSWIFEFSELAGRRGADQEKLKAFLTNTTDDFRNLYRDGYAGRPRRNVFCATTNEQTTLADATGARRFWVLAVGSIDRAGIDEVADQLWAEAVELYRTQASTIEGKIEQCLWWLSPEEAGVKAEVHDDDFIELPSLYDDVKFVLETSSVFEAEGKISNEMLYDKLGISAENKQRNMHKVADACRALGLQPAKNIGPRKVRGWARGEK